MKQNTVKDHCYWGQNQMPVNSGEDKPLLLLTGVWDRTQSGLTAQFEYFEGTHSFEGDAGILGLDLNIPLLEFLDLE